MPIFAPKALTATKRAVQSQKVYLTAMNAFGYKPIISANYNVDVPPRLVNSPLAPPILHIGTVFAGMPLSAGQTATARQGPSAPGVMTKQAPLNGLVTGTRGIRTTSPVGTRPMYDPNNANGAPQRVQTLGKVRVAPPVYNQAGVRLTPAQQQRQTDYAFARQVDKNSGAQSILASMGVGNAGNAAQAAGIGGITGIYSSSAVPRQMPKPRDR